MKYLSVSETAKKWGLSERTVRNYCNIGRVTGAVLEGKTWRIPAEAEKPARKSREKKLPKELLGRLRLEKESQLPGGIYHKVQIDLTYNSNHIEGSRLTHDQTRHIFETNTVGVDTDAVNVDDILETTNHFRCIDLVIEQADQPLRGPFLKQLHRILKAGTSDSRKSWFAVGDYKRLPNEVGGMITTAPEDVPKRIKELLTWYGQLDTVTLDDLLEFHYQFEHIRPFQDGNGRVGRLILFKECLRNQIVPFIITDDLKLYYYRGLKEWPRERGYLRDTCLTAQDRFKEYLSYFQIEYAE